MIYWIIGGLVAFWIVSVISWLILRVRNLETQLESGKPNQKPEELSGWENLEAIDLYLEGWKASQTFELKKGDKIRVTASGPKRFILHLAGDLSAKRFKSLRRTSETKNWVGTWDIESEGGYAIVAEPLGDSPFWVKIRVDRKLNRFPVHVGKVTY
jgi:hypothetical protein